jgi:tetratricopeptide (TPR) repeat protein
MLDKNNLTLKQKLIHAIDSFFKSKTILIWMFLGLVLVAFIGFSIWTEIDKKINNEATTLAEEAQSDFSSWSYENDQKKKTVLEEQLLEKIDKIIKNYSGRYAALRGSLLRAKLYFIKKDWEKSARYYLEISKTFPKSFIAPTSMVNAAVAFEEMNDLDKAIKTYTDLVAGYKNSYEVPYAIFSLGRIYEQKKSYSDATKYYTELEDKHGTSNWTLIAQNRKILLKAMGY